MESRREFLKKVIFTGGMVVLGNKAFASTSFHKKTTNPQCLLYRAVNGNPEENMVKVIGMIGGIEKLIGPDDVVVIKPNVQWWNQGAPNLMALKTFVDMLMDHPNGFKGEVVIAENCHRGKTPWNSINSGWTHHFERNSDLKGINNLNDLCKSLKERYGQRFSTVHWIDRAAGAKRVYSPEDGEGYVYCDGKGGIPLIKCDNGIKGKNYRATIMTYPIFSTGRGTKIDFKNGIYEKGKYTEQPLRFINFSALNHHSTYCGMTAAVKNYLGIADLSGGPDPYDGGGITEDYYNFHSFPFNKWAPGPEPGMLGKEIGIFMETIRKADLNITTAEWVGLSSRTEPPVAHTRAILACTDPVALDYHAAKYILYPNSKIALHNPDNKKSPLYHYLKRCAEEYGGMFDESYVDIKSYDLQKNVSQRDKDIIIYGKKTWGNSIKPVMKYVYLRYFI